MASTATIDDPSGGSTTSTLRATVTVLRHADRTPKMKLKVSWACRRLVALLIATHQFSFPAHEAWSRPFLRLLRGHREEIILRDTRQLQYILAAAEESSQTPGITEEQLVKLSQIKEALGKKMSFPGTKAQLKPSFAKKKGDKNEKKDKKKKDEDKEDEGDITETEGRKKVNDWLRKGESAQAANADSTLLTEPPMSATDSIDAMPRSGTPCNPEPETDQNEMAQGKHAGCVSDPDIPEGLEKMQLVVKWGGESTHSSRYQSRDLGDAFKKDIMIMSRFLCLWMVGKFELTVSKTRTY